MEQHFCRLKMCVSSEYDVCGALLTLGTSLNKVGNIAPSGLMNVIVHEKRNHSFFRFLLCTILTFIHVIAPVICPYSWELLIGQKNASSTPSHFRRSFRKRGRGPNFELTFFQRCFRLAKSSRISCDWIWATIIMLRKIVQNKQLILFYVITISSPLYFWIKHAISVH